MKKIIITVISTIVIVCCLIIIYVLLHSTPTIALRTHLFMTGHPVVAVTTEIVDYELRNENEKVNLEKENATCYTLTKPPFEKSKGISMKNYKVYKVGFLFFADYYTKPKQQ